VQSVKEHGTNMSLKEKAKTIAEIAREGGFNQPEASKVKWVRLEDAENYAQQKLDNLRWNLQRTIISLQKELKELKVGTKTE
jgi:thiamine pyrophosphokinase